QYRDDCRFTEIENERLSIDSRDHHCDRVARAALTAATPYKSPKRDPVAVSGAGFNCQKEASFRAHFHSGPFQISDYPWRRADLEWRINFNNYCRRHRAEISTRRDRLSLGRLVGPRQGGRGKTCANARRLRHDSEDG